MHETFDSHTASAVKHDLGSKHIGAYEGFRIGDGAVHMAFRSKIDHCVKSVFFDEPAHKLGIADITFDENILGIAKAFLYALQIHGIPGVGQLVEVHDKIFRIFFKKIVNVIGADKTTTASDQ